MEHLADRRSEDNAHEEADARGGEAPLVLVDKALRGLSASDLREEQHVQALGLCRAASEILERHLDLAELLAFARVHEDFLEVFLAELSHLIGCQLWIRRNIVVAVMHGVHFAVREGVI